MSDRPDENDKSVKDQQRAGTLYDGFRPGEDADTQNNRTEQGDTALRNQQEKGLSKEDYRPGEDSDDIRKARSEIEEHFNSRGEPYPTVIDQRTGKPMPFPEGELEKVPREDRAEWDRRTRAEFIAEWRRNGYFVPNGGWENNDIHHIRPREYGGTNDFENLVPVDRDFHGQVVTPWWNAYDPKKDV